MCNVLFLLLQCFLTYFFTLLTSSSPSKLFQSNAFLLFCGDALYMHLHRFFIVILYSQTHHPSNKAPQEVLQEYLPHGTGHMKHSIDVKCHVYEELKWLEVQFLVKPLVNTFFSQCDKFIRFTPTRHSFHHWFMKIQSEKIKSKC